MTLGARYLKWVALRSDHQLVLETDLETQVSSGWSFGVGAELEWKWTRLRHFAALGRHHEDQSTRLAAASLARRRHSPAASPGPHQFRR